MSDILIKGMEMSTDCIFCPMFRGAWTMCNVLNKTTSVKGRPDDCPLVPVPPHGRLIDANALEDELGQFCDDNWVYNTLRHAPTIIPAEEGET